MPGAPSWLPSDNLLPEIRDRAQATEDLRRLPDETVKVFRRRRLLHPAAAAAVGGLQCDPALFLLRGDASTGERVWFHRVGELNRRRTTGIWRCSDQRAQEEVWGEDPSTRISSSYAPMGAGVGRRWLPGQRVVELVRAATMPARRSLGLAIGHGRPVDFFGSFLTPRSEYEIKDVWYVASRGTGQQHRWSRGCLCPGTGSCRTKAMERPHRGGLATNSAPVYKMPWAQCIPLRFRRRLLGMAYFMPRTSAPVSGCARRLSGKGQRRTVCQGPYRRGGQRHRRRVAPIDR